MHLQGSLLRGALGFLATVGEDIRDSIPDKQLHDGDVIQIQHDVRLRCILSIFVQSRSFR